jgi:uncharacterized membrane protein
VTRSGEAESQGPNEPQVVPGPAARDTPPGFSPDNSRIIGLSDGIFAFALTLLVINLKLPDAGVVSRVGVTRAVLAQSPTFLIWLLSFGLISLYWQAHRRIYGLLTGHDGRLVWLNLLFLLCISFIWYPTELLGSYGNHQFAIGFYDGSLIVTSLVATGLWHYAAHIAGLVDASKAGSFGRSLWLATAGTVGVGLISIAVSFISVSAAELCWLLLAAHRIGTRRLGA